MEAASVTLERTSSARVEAMKARFGDRVTLSEPFPGRPPLWIEPVDPVLRTDSAAAARWTIDHHAAIEAALLDFGAVFWRGFAVEGPDDFAGLMAGFTPFSKGYVAGTSERKAVKGKVFESTRTPPEIYIFQHQELSYQLYSPRALAFHCRQPAEEGGLTLICDMRGLLEALPAEMQRRLMQDGVRYGRNLRDAKVEDWRADPAYRHHSWQHWFGSDDRDTISAQLDEREIGYRWNPDGGLDYWTIRPGTTVHPDTGQRLFFNQLYAQQQHRLCVGDAYADLMDSAYGDAHPRPYSVGYGDGTPLSEAEFFAIHDELERRAVRFDWQPGDVMLLENRLTGHGRTGFKGEREVQVMLFD